MIYLEGNFSLYLSVDSDLLLEDRLLDRLEDRREDWLDDRLEDWLEDWLKDLPGSRLARHSPYARIPKAQSATKVEPSIKQARMR